MTVCPSGQGDGLEIHWALPAGARIPRCRLALLRQPKPVSLSGSQGSHLTHQGAQLQGPASGTAFAVKRGAIFCGHKNLPQTNAQ